jgi:ubiquinone/menaquinone biosynthesis C-methylase UbiE
MKQEEKMGTEKMRFIPANKSKDEVRRIYARLSHIYDFWSSLTEQKATGRALELADIRNGENILEVAVGTGRVFEQIVSQNRYGRNEGIDLSPEMLARAEKRLRNRFSNYSLKEADAYSLPFAGETFDLVINNYMFDLLPEQDFSRVLLEFKRVLKPSGRVVITSMALGKRWYSRIWDRLARSTDLLAGCRPISLEEDVKQAGFTNIYTEYVSQFTFPSLVIRAEKP